MDFKKIIWVLILIGMVACAAVIIGYYWTATELSDIYSVPIFVLATSLVIPTTTPANNAPRVE